MPTVKISALPAAGALTGTEPVPIVQSAATKITTCQDIADLAVGGGPHWVTPVGTYFNWMTSSGIAEIRLDDTGHAFTIVGDVGSRLTWMNAGTNEFNYVSTPNNLTFTIATGCRFTTQLQAGGQVYYDDPLNKLVEQNFAAYFRGYLVGAPGSWGGAGVPTSLEVAMDRVAAAVAGLLGGPIP